MLTWWDGITSAADGAAEIVVQAQDALVSALMYPPGDLAPSIEDGGPRGLLARLRRAWRGT